MKYILGYIEDVYTLTEFKTKEEASFESEEWCEIEATTLQEAKEKYENAFDMWKMEQDLNNTK